MTLWSANAYGEIGAYYDAIGKLSASQVAAKIALHGMVGGISELAQGGNFGHGFASAGVTQGSSPLIKRLGHTKISRVFIAAIIGGLASRVSGGKFANGAVTGAFSRLFNDEGDHSSEKDAANETLNWGFDMNEKGLIYFESFTSLEEARMTASSMWGKSGIIAGREANWYIIRESLTSYRISYPNVGGVGQKIVDLKMPYTIQNYYVNQFHQSARVVEIGHNHFSMLYLKLSGTDANIFRNKKNKIHFKKLKLWMWNQKGQAYSLSYKQANSGLLQQTYYGTRQSKFDLKF